MCVGLTGTVRGIQGEQTARLKVLEYIYAKASTSVNCATCSENPINGKNPSKFLTSIITGSEFLTPLFLIYYYTEKKKKKPDRNTILQYDSQRGVEEQCLRTMVL